MLEDWLIERGYWACWLAYLWLYAERRIKRLIYSDICNAFYISEEESKKNTVEFGLNSVTSQGGIAETIITLGWSDETTDGILPDNISTYNNWFYGRRLCMMDDNVKGKALKWIFPSIDNRTVNNDSFCFRLEKAKEQYELPAVSKDEIKELVNKFLKSLKMEAISNPEYLPRKVTDRTIGIRRINYSKIWNDNMPKQTEKEDIVWIKFVETKEGKNRHISVVGVGCDISFTDNTKNTTSSGKILKELNLEWDDKEILIFPLKNIPAGLKRSDIESGIGNYLIDNGVPILDFYSHNF